MVLLIAGFVWLKRHRRECRLRAEQAKALELAPGATGLMGPDGTIAYVGNGAMGGSYHPGALDAAERGDSGKQVRSASLALVAVAARGGPAAAAPSAAASAASSRSGSAAALAAAPVQPPGAAAAALPAANMQRPGAVAAAAPAAAAASFICAASASHPHPVTLPQHVDGMQAVAQLWAQAAAQGAGARWQPPPPPASSPAQSSTTLAASHMQQDELEIMRYDSGMSATQRELRCGPSVACPAPAGRCALRAAAPQRVRLASHAARHVPAPGLVLAAAELWRSADGWVCRGRPCLLPACLPAAACTATRC